MLSQTGAATASTRDALRALLERHVAASPHFRFANLSTLDGFPVASAGAGPAPGRIAAIASSFLALGETLAREAAAGRAGYLTLTAHEALVVVVRVEARGTAYALAAGASRDDNLATLLRLTLDTGEALRGVLDG